MIGERRAEKVDRARTNERRDARVERRAVVPRMPRERIGFRPLDRARKRRRDVHRERHAERLVRVERTVVARARAGVDERLDLVARQNRLVAVQQRDDLDAFAAVVVRLQSDPRTEHAVRARDALLVGVVIGRDPVVAQRVADVAATSDISRANRIVARAVLRREDLINQIGCIDTVPARVFERLPRNRKLHRVDVAVEIRLLETVHRVLIAGLHAELREFLPDLRRVVRRVGVHIHAPVVARVAGDDRLPAHCRAGVHVVGQIEFTRARMAKVKRHVKIEAAIFGERFQVVQIHAEVKFPITARRSVAPVVRVKCDDVARRIEAVVRVEDIAALIVETIAVVRIERDEIVRRPVGERVVVRHAADRRGSARPDRDRARRGRLREIGNVRVGAVEVFLQV